MKIIAEIDRDTFLIQASSQEIARCSGWYSNYAAPDGSKAKVGLEINISEAYECATGVIAGSVELAAAKTALQKVISSVEKFQTVLDPKSALIKSKLPKT